MDGRPRLRFSPRLVFGLAILTLGVVLLLGKLEILDPDKVIQYWPLVLVAFGLAKLLQRGAASGRVGGAILTIVGVFVLLLNLDLIKVDFDVIWPLALVVLGVWIVARAVLGVKSGAAAEAGSGAAAITDTGTTFSTFALMAGVNRKATSKELRGGDATAIMGGCEIDLRDASPAGGEASIDVFALWGGIEILVPGDWTVVNNVTPIMGGVEDSRKTVGSDPTKRLVVKGLALMGGVEIKN